MIYDFYSINKDFPHFSITEHNSLHVMNGNYDLIEQDDEFIVPVSLIKLRLIGHLEGRDYEDYNSLNYRFSKGERKIIDNCICCGTLKAKLKLYLLEQNDNRGYDTFSDIVVCAESEKEARNIHPRGSWQDGLFRDETWARSPENVIVTYLGKADESIKKGIISASFRAG